MRKYSTFTAQNGITFGVLLVPASGEYLLADRDLVEFYDTRYSYGQYGQFISRYDADQIKSGRAGLYLHGGVLEWQIDADTMRQIREWLWPGPGVHPDGIETFADALQSVWGEWADQDISEFVDTVATDLRALAKRIRTGEW